MTDEATWQEEAAVNGFCFINVIKMVSLNYLTRKSIY